MVQPTPRVVANPISMVVIPARLHSTRLPRKLLLAESGKPLIQHTYEAARKARRPRGVCVATDHEEIRDAVRAFGGQAFMTRPDWQSGTDRIAEVARRLDDVEIVVNVQGDEPEIGAEAIDRCIDLLAARPDALVATLATPIRSLTQLHDPACVKVVCDGQGRAMYFSRSMIPHPREWRDDLLQAEPPLFLQHVGLYAYRRDFLLRFGELPACRLEGIEKLEQLRVLHAGGTILVETIDAHTAGIDTPADYQAFLQRQRRATRAA